jgi:hypothetical protein
MDAHIEQEKGARSAPFFREFDPDSAPKTQMRMGMMM